MSITSAPTIRLPNHNANNALSLLLDGYVSDEEIDAIEDLLGDTPAWAALGKSADSLLTKTDKYLNKAAKELWIETSFYTGNTRGSLKQDGYTYPEVDLVFDEVEWRMAKTLTNLKTKTVYRSWTNHGSKHHPKSESRSQTYTYAPGTIKVIITGEDYAPRIPLPPHGGGKIDALIRTYEELKNDAWLAAGFSHA